ncbi:MAG: phosphonate metabolism transcriptional regulator PhnF [Sulfitobacter sp.]
MKTPSAPRTPVWQAIANTLRSELSDQRYRPGDKLPTEAALSDRFGVNRHTVRHAISKLVDEGLVRTRRGAGAFVAQLPTDYPIGARVRFHESLLAAGRSPEKRVLHIERRGATAGEAKVLKLETGALVCAYHGISLADEQPIALFESVFPLVRLAGLDEVLMRVSSVTQALAQVGIADYTRSSTRLTAVRADVTQALQLHVNEGDPLIRSTGVNVDVGDMPVEYGRAFFAGDKVTLTLDRE